MTVYLYHYYEASHGPFRNLSDLPLAEAERIQSQIRQEGKIFASQRSADYLTIRRDMDGKPYRRQVYTIAELPQLIETYGLPQEWNASGKLGPDRYIEAQVWADEPLLAYLPVNPT